MLQDKLIFLSFHKILHTTSSGLTVLDNKTITIGQYWEKIIRIYIECELQIDNPVMRDYCSASIPSDGIFSLQRARIIIFINDMPL